MAKKSGIKFNPKGFEQLRHDPRVEQYLLAMAKRIAAAAGGESMGFKVTELVLEDPRSAVSVMATGHAAAHNRKHHSLLRALEAGRG